MHARTSLVIFTFDGLTLQEAGADATYVEAPRSIDELKEIAKRQKVTASCISLVRASIRLPLLHCAVAEKSVYGSSSMTHMPSFNNITASCVACTCCWHRPCMLACDCPLQIQPYESSFSF